MAGSRHRSLRTDEAIDETDEEEDDDGGGGDDLLLLLAEEHMMIDDDSLVYLLVNPSKDQMARFDFFFKFSIGRDTGFQQMKSPP